MRIRKATAHETVYRSLAKVVDAVNAGNLRLADRWLQLALVAHIDVPKGEAVHA